MYFGSFSVKVHFLLKQQENIAPFLLTDLMIAARQDIFCSLGWLTFWYRVLDSIGQGFYSFHLKIDEQLLFIAAKL